MNVCVQPTVVLFMFYIELAVHAKSQEMAHKSLMSGFPQQVCSSGVSGPNPMEAVP